MGEQESGWRYVAACAIGTSHLKTGLPCQDAYACDIVRGVDGSDYLVAVVSDGAGSAAHSDQGSSIACQAWRSFLTDHLALGGAWPIERAQLEGWLADFQAKISKVAEEFGTTGRDYACTLLVAVIGPSGATFLQVGDGAIVVAGRDMPGTYAPVFWPDQGEYANQTIFATSPEAFARVQIEFMDEHIEEVALFSDGIQNLVLNYRDQTAHARWFEDMFRGIRSLASAGYSDEMSAALDRFLSGQKVNERTDDDKTLILASRRPPQLPAEHEQPRDETPHAP